MYVLDINKLDIKQLINFGGLCMKKNILILNNHSFRNFYRNEKLIIDSSLYNIYIITNKEKANQIRHIDYIELHAIDSNCFEERAFEIAKELHEKYKINNVVAISEKTVLLAGKIRDYCQIEGMGYDDIIPFRDKFVMKSRLSDAGIKVPRFTLIKNLGAAENFFNSYGKCVIKPRFGMGSQNTYVINSLEQLRTIFNIIRNNLLDYTIEEYINGHMYVCNSIVDDKKIILCSISKYMESSLVFSEGTSMAIVMEDDANLIEKITNFNEWVINTLGLKKGVTHHELFVDIDENITFCEIAARAGGGGTVRVIEQSFDINLIEAYICLEIGQPLPQIKETGFLSCELMFFTKGGTISQIPPSTRFKEDWIPFFKINIDKCEKIPASRDNSDTIASFIIVGRTKQELFERIDTVRKEFTIIYED